MTGTQGDETRVFSEDLQKFGRFRSGAVKPTKHLDQFIIRYRIPPYISSYSALEKFKIITEKSKNNRKEIQNIQSFTQNLSNGVRDRMRERMNFISVFPSLCCKTLKFLTLVTKH